MVKRIRVVNPTAGSTETEAVAAPVVEAVVEAVAEAVVAPVAEAVVAPVAATIAPKTTNGGTNMANNYLANLTPEQKMANQLKMRAVMDEKKRLGQETFKLRKASAVVAEILPELGLTEVNKDVTTEITVDSILSKYVNTAILIERENAANKAAGKPVTPINISITKADYSRLVKLVTYGIGEALKTSSVELEAETPIKLTNKYRGVNNNPICRQAAGRFVTTTTRVTTEE